jgi:hypothetical protein
VGDKSLSSLRGYFFIVIAGEEGAAIGGVEFGKELLDSNELIGGFGIGSSKDVEPCCKPIKFSSGTNAKEEGIRTQDGP